jgi:Fe-S-cluster containining protein
MKLKEIQARLDEIYSLIPDFACKSCGRCCGPINWRIPEGLVIKKYMEKHGIEHVVWTHEDYEENDMNCPYLKENKCIIYPVRPLVCRLQGHLMKLRCPYHCKLVCEHCEEKFDEIKTGENKTAPGQTVTCPACNKTTTVVYDEKYGDISEQMEEKMYRMINGLEKKIMSSYSDRGRNR